MSTQWYVGAQNDGLYLIDQPPRPSTDAPHHDADVRVLAAFRDATAAERKLATAAPRLAEALVGLQDALLPGVAPKAQENARAALREAGHTPEERS